MWLFLTGNHYQTVALRSNITLVELPQEVEGLSQYRRLFEILPAGTTLSCRDNVNKVLFALQILAKVGVCAGFNEDAIQGPMHTGHPETVLQGVVEGMGSEGEGELNTSQIECDERKGWQ